MNPKQKKCLRHNSPNVFVSKRATLRPRKRNTAFVFVYSDGAIVMRAGETIDEFMVRHGVFDKLLAQLDNVPHSTDWEAELDELRNRTAIFS